MRTISVTSSDEFRFDLSNLPATRVEKGQKFVGCFLVVFSALWGGLPTASLVVSLVTRKFEPAMLLLLLFTVIGAGMFLGGLHMLFGRTETTLDVGSVTVRKRTLFGRTEWTEPLSRYEGVLSRSEYHSGGKNSPSYTLYIVELAHADKKKYVPLFQSRSDEDFRRVWEDYGRQLNLPAVEADGGALVKRAPEDLDKSVRELVAEGKIAVTFDPSRPPPRGIRVRVDGDTLEVTLERKRIPRIGVLFMLLIPSVFMYLGFFVKGPPIVFGVVGAIFFVIFLAVIVWTSLTREQIRLHAREVHVQTLTPWGGPTPGSRIPTSTIESVRIGSKSGEDDDGVCIETDTGATDVGQGLSPEALAWLKQCLLRVISA